MYDMTQNHIGLPRCFPHLTAFQELAGGRQLTHRCMAERESRVEKPSPAKMRQASRKRI